MPAERTHLMICRAADAHASGAHATVRLGLPREPSDEQIAKCRDEIAEAFRGNFKREPSRVGVVVLPWVEDDDV